MKKTLWLFLGLTILVPVYTFSSPVNIFNFGTLAVHSTKKSANDTLPAVIPQNKEQITPGKNTQKTPLGNRKKAVAGQRYSSVSPGTYLFAVSPESALRRQPSINADIIKILKTDTKLIFLERHVSWFKVKVAETGQVGYIHQYMVK